MLGGLFGPKEVEQVVHFDLFQSEDGKANKYFTIAFDAKVLDRYLKCEITCWEDLDGDNRADCKPIMDALDRGFPDRTMPVYFYVKNNDIVDFNFDMSLLVEQTGDERVENMDYDYNFKGTQF
ncbi:MAG: hypothetical protein K6E70_05900 [Butyrivibrio sp.]|nr:hypothetical protein [Butyrivibrio sp.]